MNACNPKAYTSPGGDAMQADLATQRHPTPLLLAPIGGKTVELDCDGGHLSSDAGLVLLQVAYLGAADIVSRPLPIRLREVNQPVIITRNRFSSPHPRLLTCI
jgi:hypothetical protein